MEGEDLQDKAVGLFLSCKRALIQRISVFTAFTP
jgi:hypothetical protein